MHSVNVNDIISDIVRNFIIGFNLWWLVPWTVFPRWTSEVQHIGDTNRQHYLQLLSWCNIALLYVSSMGIGVWVRQRGNIWTDVCICESRYRTNWSSTLNRLLIFKRSIEEHRPVRDLDRFNTSQPSPMSPTNSSVLIHHCIRPKLLWEISDCMIMSNLMEGIRTPVFFYHCALGNDANFLKKSSEWRSEWILSSTSKEGSEARPPSLINLYVKNCNTDVKTSSIIIVLCTYEAGYLPLLVRLSHIEVTTIFFLLWSD